MCPWYTAMVQKRRPESAASLGISMGIFDRDDELSICKSTCYCAIIVPVSPPIYLTPVLDRGYFVRAGILVRRMKNVS